MIKKAHALIAPLVGLGIVSPTQAAFIENGQGGFELKNFYFGRDFKDAAAAQSKREEWAQGFTLKMQSGYTEGVFGFGLDAVGMLGVKLDSSPDRSGTGLLPRNSKQRAADDYSKLSLTGKVKFAQSNLLLGGLSPQLPMLASNTSRLFPQIFSGGLLTVQDFSPFVITLAQIDGVKQRDSTNTEDLNLMSQLGAFPTVVTSDKLMYAGLDYSWESRLTLSAHSSEMQDVFRRDYFGAKYTLPLGKGKLSAELRGFNARESGRRLAGQIDNRTLSSNLAYAIGGHIFSGGYQKVSGDNAFVYVGGSDTYLFSEMQVSTFSYQDERVWHARYDYNFAAMGLPGLTFNARYVVGDNVNPAHVRTVEGAQLRASSRKGREHETSTDLTYVIQSGPAKNLSLRWRFATNRSNFADGADEHRIIVAYAIPF